MILPRILKSLIACAAAALLGPMICLFGLLFGSLFIALVSGGPLRGEVNQIGPALFIGLLIPFCLALTMSIVFWMPTQALMQKWHQTGFVLLSCGGCFFGLGLALLIDYNFQIEEQQGVGPGIWSFHSIAWSLCLYGLVMGGLCSSLTWIFRRPDKDESFKT